MLPDPTPTIANPAPTTPANSCLQPYDPVTTSAKCACNHAVVNIYEIVHMGDNVVIVVVFLLMVLERQGTIIQDYDEDRDMTPQRCFDFAQMIPEPPISYDARNMMTRRAQSRS